MTISFFIPAALWPSDLPTSADQNWAGYGLGIYAWTVQTFLRLRAAGVVCELTSQLPAEGVVLCHSNALRSVVMTIDEAADPRRFIVCIKAEAPLSAIAPMHIVQNPSEASLAANRYFMPHWPQPQLLSRSLERGDRFESLAFFGHDNSLAAELSSPDWQQALAERNLRWQTVVNTNHWNQYHNLSTRWNDYRDVDAVIAVRSFDLWQRRLTNHFGNKPATKLYNAWLGGVIPILGVESAYRQTGNRVRGNTQDYVEVKSFSKLLVALDRLQENVEWRRSLLAQGAARQHDYTPEKIVRKWQVFLEAVAIPAYREWRSYAPRQRRQAMMAAKLSSNLNRVSARGRRVLLEALTQSSPPTP